MAAKQVLRLASVAAAFDVTLNCVSNWRNRPTDPLPIIKRGHFVFVEPAVLKRWAKAAGKEVLVQKELHNTTDLPKEPVGPALNKPKSVHKVLTAAENRRKKRTH